MYELFVFRRRLHYILVDTCDFAAVISSSPPPPPLPGLAGAEECARLSHPVQCLSSSWIFFGTKWGCSNFCEKYTIKMLTSIKIDINVKRRKVMLNRLTFSWFVGKCNLSHPATGPQEALWNMVKIIFDSQACCLAPLILLLIHYFNLLMLFKWRKEARDTETAISVNIPDCLQAKSQAYSSAWP